MLAPTLRDALAGEVSATGTDAKQVETALSFGYEWHRFPEMYNEWERQFLDYMQPHGPEFFRGKKVLFLDPPSENTHRNAAAGR